MITIEISRPITADDIAAETNYIEGSCLSTDDKPTTGVKGGSKLLEIDTSTLYVYDEENTVWRAWA